MIKIMRKFSLRNFSQVKIKHHKRISNEIMYRNKILHLNKTIFKQSQTISNIENVARNVSANSNDLKQFGTIINNLNPTRISSRILPATECISLNLRRMSVR